MTTTTTVQSGPRMSLWTIKDCAAYLQRSPRWLWSAITQPATEAGSIPHVRIGASPRFFPDDITAWVRAGCPPAATFAEWRNVQIPRSNRLSSAHVTPSCPANKTGG